MRACRQRWSRQKDRRWLNAWTHGLHARPTPSTWRRGVCAPKIAGDSGPKRVTTSTAVRLAKCARRAAWRTQARKLLRTGQSERLMAELARLGERQPRAKALRRELNYFRRNPRRLAYAWARHLRLPIGSGPLERAIRRGINLRLKGPGIFWLEPTAEAMLLLRAFSKAGRWHEPTALACSVPAETL